MSRLFHDVVLKQCGNKTAVYLDDMKIKGLARVSFESGSGTDGPSLITMSIYCNSLNLTDEEKRRGIK